MRRRVATSRVTFQKAALQKAKLHKSAEQTELNYRTCVTTSAQDNATTFRLASIATLIFIVVGFGLRLIAVLPLVVSVPLFFLLFLGMMAAAYWKFLREMPSTEELLLALAVLVVSVLFGLVNYAPTMRSAYVLIFGTALFLTAVFSHFVTVQACAFMAVNERIPWRTMRRWRRHSRRVELFATHLNCPELADYRLSYVILIAAFALGFGVVAITEQTERGDYAAIIGVVGFLVSLIAFRLIFDDAQAHPLRKTIEATWKALTTFVCYNRHGVGAPGLFRFPTKALRPSLVRDVLLGLTLAFLTTALVGVSVSSPSVLIARYWNAPRAPETKPDEFRLNPTEEQFSRTLPTDQQKPYFEAKRKEHEVRQTESQWAGVRRTAWNILIATGIVLLLCWLGPFAVLCTVTWFTGGKLLARFYEALEAPDAYEVPEERTEEELKDGKRDVIPWDNRIQRMRLSQDKLETEHFYLGSSIEGDFPVLLHQDLLYRHAHILGDTGSRKTSIGIAPLVTQLIAREKNSVVIIDLKGDRALFNAVKEEADQVGLPFKHFTNIVGKSSYVFNPLRQSHSHRLTTDQLAQGILQALELEHGEGYGRGHFTALNDLVLTGFYRKFRRHIGSFAELHRYLSDRNAYRKISDNDDDWQNTRQLVNLVEKIANLGPMNATAESLKDKPQAIEHQIGVTSRNGI